jgi:hypothetical protein
MRTLRAALFGIAIMAAPGCDDNSTTTLMPISPLGPSAPALGDLVEYRVSGDLALVIVRTANSFDGLSQVTTGLPYTHRVTLTGREPVFLSLDARAVSGSGFLHAALFINGVIFREASGSGFAPVVSVSGTFRR